jgi:cytochrome c-type biogenesis protein
VVAEGASSTVEFPVGGMTCAGCVNSIDLALSRLPGVRGVAVDLAGQRVSVVGAAGSLDEPRLRAEVQRLGYDVGADVRPQRVRRLGPVFGLAGLVVVIAAGFLVFRSTSDRYLGSGVLERLNELFAQPSAATIGLALVFGLLVGFAPSTFAMAPAVMGFVGAAKPPSLGRAVRLSAAFVGGMVIVDIALGAVFALAGAAALRFVGERLGLFYALVVVLLVVMALINLGVWRPALPARAPHPRAVTTARGGLLLGLPFGLLTCPACTPLLLPVALGAAATGNPVYGGALLGLFALGRGIPLILLGASAGGLRGLRAATRSVVWVERVIGVLLLIAALFFVREFIMVGGLSSLL